MLSKRAQKELPSFTAVSVARLRLCWEFSAQAHVTFQKLIDDYPESPLVDDAEKSIEYLGLTPEEIMNIIMMSQFVEEEIGRAHV